MIVGFAGSGLKGAALLIYNDTAVSTLLKNKFNLMSKDELEVEIKAAYESHPEAKTEILKMAYGGRFDESIVRKAFGV